ncbi:LPS export ABC transporter permease LptF [Taylorella equigenitalis]|uniref:Lipopolysaccharide export system permease protein LptF n=1 Tax=Taylorella equigenitalis 14/56 TaxID=1091497 RepID=I7IAN8_9BURK|nr:LPS export ABC transporter permease LptF [Taylorella equigenitalis]ASY30252.1 LPS export ABC transporter permease LptF [Taylorella equigenitalis]ASY37555.1 LPS export ABC transporter permease LptF [Taylorella equigenitalis]ASY40543.1 LPS export ABC transporter permease LptF [Taylorella equigenitalis]ASY41978.1 LPS export ABC transporter permease LptF [Taylorella equigenitalis]KGK33124.1 hypothetical protein LW90_05460 [Taylorella equigenitalis]
MILFKRSVVSEILNNAGVVFSTLLIVWLSVLLARLLAQAASGIIGPDLVLGISAFSSITALPIILIVSLFISIITTVSRNYREQEMYVWFTTGVSLVDWIKPVLRIAIPVSVVIAILTIVTSPWAYLQIEEYRQRYAQRSDFSKIVQGQFLETDGGARVFFIEPSENNNHEFGKIFAREVTEEWISILNADYGDFKTNFETGERYIELGSGTRYDIRIGTPEFRASKFSSVTMNINQKNSYTEEQIRTRALEKIKARPFTQLIKDNNSRSDSQILWRLSLPLAALNLALLGIPLGSVNPRMGKSADIFMAALVGMLYMNLLNVMRGWVAAEQIGLWTGFVLVNGLFSALAVFLFWYKLRIRKPKKHNEYSAI